MQPTVVVQSTTQAEWLDAFNRGLQSKHKFDYTPQPHIQRQNWWERQTVFHWKWQSNVCNELITNAKTFSFCSSIQNHVELRRSPYPAISFCDPINFLWKHSSHCASNLSTLYKIVWDSNKYAIHFSLTFYLLKARESDKELQLHSKF